jgi:hypothetical protein
MSAGKETAFDLARVGIHERMEVEPWHAVVWGIPHLGREEMRSMPLLAWGDSRLGLCPGIPSSATPKKQNDNVVPQRTA